MSTISCFIEPLDVLFLRGNKLFGDPGSYGESLVPPWPSVAAGAIRSRMLADAGIDLAAFGQGKIEHAELGTPATPGAFTVTVFQLARRLPDGRVEALIAPPADLVINEGDSGKPVIRRLQPTALADGLAASSSLPLLPVLAETKRGKPTGGYWLTESGWQQYLAGHTPVAADLVKSSQLWGIDHRVGVGLDAEQRRAADGRLFSVQAVAMKKREHDKHEDDKRDDHDIGFLASVSGATIPQNGLLRLAGDGRGAALHAVRYTPPQADLAAIAQARRCRIVLTSPGLFTDGWRLSGVDADGNFNLSGVKGRVVSAAVPRFETISGWDLARYQPKPAQRVAPAGSIYWLDELDATPEALDKLATRGLWLDPCEDASRRAEGFNRFAFAAY